MLYQHYIDLVSGLLDKHFARDYSTKIIEVGGYNGYLLQCLAEQGYTDLTLVDPSACMDLSIAEKYGVRQIKECFTPKVVQQSKMEGYFDFVACKNTINMISDVREVCQAFNQSLKVGGILLCTSALFERMHSLQRTHFSLNAYECIAQIYGFKILSLEIDRKAGYTIAVMQKVQDVDAQSLNQAAEQNQVYEVKHDALWQKRQAQSRELLRKATMRDENLYRTLNEAVAKAIANQGEIVLYGTGFQSFYLLTYIDQDLSKLNFTIVDSHKEYDGMYFMMPDGSLKQVKYSVDALKDKQAELLIWGVSSPLFKAEIEKLLQSINFSCNNSFYYTGS